MEKAISDTTSQEGFFEDIDALILESEESFFVPGNDDLDLALSELIANAATNINLDTLATTLQAFAEKRKSWHSHSARWQVIFLKLQEKFQKPPPKDTQSDPDEEPPPEETEPEPEPDEDEDEESSGGRFFERLGQEFGKPDPVKDWFAKKLPRIFIIGPLVMLIVRAYKLMVFCWDKFVELLVWIGEKLDLQNNIFTFITWLSKTSFLARIFVQIVATLIYFADWIIAAVIRPLLAFVRNPVDKSRKIVEEKLKSKSSKGDEEEKEDSETDDGPESG